MDVIMDVTGCGCFLSSDSQEFLPRFGLILHLEDSEIQ